MHIRNDSHTRKNGTRRTRVSIAHNIRVENGQGGSVTKPIEILPLGRLEELDDDMLGQAIALLQRFRAERRAELAEQGTTERPAEEAVALRERVKPHAPLIRLLMSKQLGVRMVIEHVWRELGLAEVFTEIERDRCRTLALERIVFAMVLNRLVDPASKRECVEWVKLHAWLPEGKDWDVDHFYAALDVMERHRAEILQHITRTVFERATPEERRLLLVDTTTTFSEAVMDDDTIAEIAREWAAHDRGEAPQPEDPRPQVVNNPSLRRRGHSKDHRPDAPQIVIGLAATASGEPVWQEVYAGNTSDKAITFDLVEKTLSSFPGQKLVVAMDSGMAGRPNLRRLAGLSSQVGWIAGVPVRGNALIDAALLGSSSWPTFSKGHGDTWEVLTIPLPRSERAHSERAERLVLIRSQSRRRRDLRKLDKEIAKVRAILAEDDRAQVDGKPSEAISKPALRRLVMEENGRLSVNETAVTLERARCGVKAQRTTEVNGDAGELMRDYDQLLNLEDRFKDFKHPVALRPMYHRSAERIRAHALLCLLAVLCLRLVERKTGQRWEKVRPVLETIDAVKMQRGVDTWWQRSLLSAEAEAILASLGLRAGPERWASESVSLTHRVPDPP
jgi:transposase